MATENPHKISKLHTSLTATGAIRDDLDFPHAGLFRAMGQYAKGNFAIKAALTDFDISFNIDSGFSRITVAAGKVFVHNKYVEVSALTNLPLNTSYDDGETGTNADLTPLDGSYAYFMIVYDPDEGGIRIRGSSNSGHNNYSGGKIPLFMSNGGMDKPDDVPIAILRQNNTADDDGHAAIAIQYLTTSLSENSVEIGFPTGSHPDKIYNQAMTISSDADGDVTIESKVADKDIYFKVNDGGSSKEVMRIDASLQTVYITNDSDSTNLVLDNFVDSSSASPVLILRKNRNPSATAHGDDIGYIKFNSYNTAGSEEQITFADMYAEALETTDGDECGSLNIRAYADGTKRSFIRLDGGSDHDDDISLANTTTELVINEDGADIDFRVESDDQSRLLHCDAGLNRVAILGDGTPTSTLEVNGNFGATITTTTAGTFTLDDEHTLLVNNGSGALITLPDANGIAGRIYYVKNIHGSAAAAAINTGSDTIDGTNYTGGGPLAIPALMAYGFQSDGTNWWIISQYAP